MGPKHTNRLVHETSPYLLQHAHNPVDWYPWGEEALTRAKNETPLGGQGNYPHAFQRGIFPLQRRRT